MVRKGHRSSTPKLMRDGSSWRNNNKPKTTNKTQAQLQAQRKASKTDENRAKKDKDIENSASSFYQLDDSLDTLKNEQLRNPSTNDISSSLDISCISQHGEQLSFFDDGLYETPLTQPPEPPTSTQDDSQHQTNDDAMPRLIDQTEARRLCQQESQASDVNKSLTDNHMDQNKDANSGSEEVEPNDDPRSNEMDISRIQCKQRLVGAVNKSTIDQSMGNDNDDDVDGAGRGDDGNNDDPSTAKDDMDLSIIGNNNDHVSNPDNATQAATNGNTDTNEKHTNDNANGDTNGDANGDANDNVDGDGNVDGKTDKTSDMSHVEEHNQQNTEEGNNNTNDIDNNNNDNGNDDHNNDGNDDGSESTNQHKNDSAPENTPPPPLPLPVRANRLRYDMKLKVKPNTNDPVKALREAITQMYDKIREQDVSLVVYPWTTEDQMIVKDRIFKAAEIPNNPVDIKKYFSRAIPRPKGGVMYVSVVLGTAIDFARLNGNLKWWLDREHMGLYVRQLQVEKTKVVGWLLYSTQKMDPATLAHEIERMTGISAGIRWRMISPGKGGQLPLELQVKALHVEVDETNLDSDRLTIRCLYSSARTSGFPLGVRMRLVPEIMMLSNPKARENFRRLSNRQAGFTQKVQTCRTWEIASLDHRDHHLDNDSLRSLLMKIYSQSFPHLTLFHSIDPHWRGDGFEISFLPQVEEEARAMIMGMLPFLRHHVKVPNYYLDKCFSSSAVARANTARWNVELGAVITEDDDWLNSIDGAGNDTAYVFEMELAIADKAEVSAEKEAVDKEQVEPIIAEEDSIETFNANPVAKIRKVKN